VYPFLVPFVPLADTPMANHPTPDADTMRSLYTDVAAAIRGAGLGAAQMKAGCAKCGACSALSSYEANP